MKVSDYIVKFFEKENVKHLFMVSGGGCMHLVDSFGKSKKIEYICTHHEQSAAFAAEAYAKYKGDLGIVLVTSGPGSTNTITGLLGAYQDSVPCVFISGQSKRMQTVYNANIPKLRQFGIQEANIIPIVESISKYTVMINDPNEIKYHLEKAVYLAKHGRPGPVWLDIPLDVQSALIKENELQGFNTESISKDYKEEPSKQEIDFVINELKKAKRPIIIAGYGIRLSGACEIFQEFVKTSEIPVVTTFMGIDLLPTTDKMNIGRIGTKGTRAGNFAMQNADFILCLGTRLAVSVIGHEYNQFAREAKIAIVDIDIYEHQKKTIRIDKFINADVNLFLQQVNKQIQQVNKHEYKQWIQQCNIWKKTYPVSLDSYKKNKKGINYYSFIDILTHKMDKKTPIISDAGSSFYVVSQAANIKKGQRYITSGAIATMGFGLPAAIGVCKAIKNQLVVTITGDGSFQQNLQELSVVKYHAMPVKVFVTNNNGYLSIRQTQEKFFNKHYVGESDSSGLSFPKYSKIAEAYSLEYILIKNIQDLEKKLTYIFSKKNPMLIEVKLLTHQEIIPTNAAYISSDGKMTSKPLEDMYPFLDRNEFKNNMFIPIIEE